jgi:hypothetical protein
MIIFACLPKGRLGCAAVRGHFIKYYAYPPLFNTFKGLEVFTKLIGMFMKNIFYSLLLCLAAETIANAQLVTKPPDMMTNAELGQYYLKKSKNSKTWGWIMVAASAGFYIASNAMMQDDKVYDTDNAGGKAFFLLGTGALVGTIPLFTSAARNKGRSEVLLGLERQPIGYLPKGYQGYPAVGVRIPISK